MPHHFSSPEKEEGGKEDGGEDRVVSGGTEGGSIGTIRGGLWKLTGNEWGRGGRSLEY